MPVGAASRPVVTLPFVPWPVVRAGLAARIAATVVADGAYPPLAGAPLPSTPHSILVPLPLFRIAVFPRRAPPAAEHWWRRWRRGRRGSRAAIRAIGAEQARAELSTWTTIIAFAVREPLRSASILTQAQLRRWWWWHMRVRRVRVRRVRVRRVRVRRVRVWRVRVRIVPVRIVPVWRVLVIILQPTPCTPVVRQRVSSRQVARRRAVLLGQGMAAQASAPDLGARAKVTT